jgi:Leucine-rich repeat (LRR) protein
MRIRSSCSAPALATLLLLSAHANAAIPASERNALIAFYNSTNGNSWIDNTGWNGAAGTECSWFGVQCDNGATTVIILFLPANGLSGTLPALTGLPHLQELYVQDNAIGGTLPALAQLVDLNEFYANGNQFTGQIPALSGLTALVNFDVSGNQLSGGLPAFTGLTSLAYFNAEDNTLSGSVPSLAGLSALQIIAVDSNNLSGNLPSLAGLPSLQQVGLSYNQFTGTIPPLSGIAGLTYISVAANQLTGSLPSLTGLTQLQGFDASLNQLSGTIPSLTGLGELQQIWLDGNQLSGTIPALSGLSKLQALGVSGNQLTGSLPQLSGLANLQYFYAGNNQLTGPVPALTGLVALNSFDVDGNQLSGSAPALAGLTQLTYFSVARNQLTGTLSALTGLTNLGFYDVSFNQLSGAVPAFSGLVNLQFVYLDFNQLTGPIPSLAGLGKLQEFVVLDNKLTGTIPALTGLSSLQAFNAEGNQLSGALPSLTGLSNLAYFSATGNQLGGPLPALTGLTSLETFDVSFNQITGSIPPLTQLPNLQYLYLDVNQLSGAIPSLSGLTNLLVFDANSNKLSGSIPSLSGLANLQEFNVYSNQLTGTLPALTGLGNLQYFEVGSNFLSGAIPAVPSPDDLIAGLSSLCPNALTPTPDTAWDDATGETPWYTTCAATQSKTANNAPTAKDSTHIALSGDGSIKVFQSQETDLVAGNVNPTGQDIYTIGPTGMPVLEDIDESGHQMIGIASLPAISSDGNVVAFLFAPLGSSFNAQTTGMGQIYAGQQGGPKHRVDTGTSSVPPDLNAVGGPSLSSVNGTNQIVFCSASSTLVSGDTNSMRDVFIADPLNAAAAIGRVSTDSNGNEIAGDSCEPKLSLDGTKVVFSVSAPGLFGISTRQIALKNLGTAAVGHSPITGEGGLTLISVSTPPPVGGVTHGANADSSEPAINGDGSVVVFTSQASDLDAKGAPVGGHEAFVSMPNAATGVPVVIRARSGDGTVPNGGSQQPQVSGDGTTVVIQTDATNWQGSTPTQCGAIALNTNFFATSAMGGALCNSSAGGTANQNPTISADGITSGFDSNARQVNGNTNSNTYAQGMGSTTGIAGQTVPNLSGDFSGQWFNPDQSGHGLVIDVLRSDAANNRLLLLTWFVYLNGQPSWVTGVGVPHAGSGLASNTVIVDMDQVAIFKGVAFPLGEARATPSLWGSITLAFKDANTGTLTWHSQYPGFSSGTMPIAHLLGVGLPAQDAPNAKIKSCFSGPWYDPAQSGQGFEIEILPTASPPILSVDWFTYDPSGNPVWVAGAGPISGNSAQVPLAFISGPGAQFPPNFDPSQITKQLWGTVTFTFSDTGHGQAAWNSTLPGYGSGSMSIQPVVTGWFDRRSCD